MGGASPYLGAVRAEHVGPAARSLHFALLEPTGLGELLSVRRANVRSRSEIRKFASEGTKQGGDNHQTTILDLVRPTAHELSRAGFPPRTPTSTANRHFGQSVDNWGPGGARSRCSPDCPASSERKNTGPSRGPRPLFECHLRTLPFLTFDPAFQVLLLWFKKLKAGPLGTAVL